MSRRRAVIVGINDYQGTSNDLPSSVKDAESFRDYLNHKLGFTEIKVLVDKQATRSNVTTALDWLFEHATSNDRLVFFYSGHGTTKPDGNVMQEYLCLYDDILQDEELTRRTQELPEGVFTAIIDSCFSGGMEKRRYEAVVHGFNESQTRSHVPHLSIERAQVKTFLSDAQQIRVHDQAEEKATFFKPFAQPTRVTPSGFVKSMPAQADESADLSMRGTLLIGSIETETAVACTSQTNGLSAFTYSLLRVFEGNGLQLPMFDLVQLVTMELRMLGLRQTPRIKAQPMMLVNRTFLNLEHIAINPTYSGSHLDRQKVESLVYAALNNAFNPGNPYLTTALTTQNPVWRNFMYAQMDRPNVAHLVAAVMPHVADHVQREHGRRAQVPFATQYNPWLQPMSMQQPSLFGGAFQQPGFGFAPFTAGSNRQIGFYALESAQRIALQVLQTLPIEYRSIVQPTLSACLPSIIEVVTREFGRINPIAAQVSYNVRERQYVDSIVYNVIVSVVESVIREHHIRSAQQFGWNQPQFGWSQPQIGWNQPQIGWNQPQFGWNQQQFGWNQLGLGSGANFGTMLPQEQQMITQTIAAFIPTIVELCERERARLNQLGQTFTNETLNALTQQVLSHVQSQTSSAAVLSMIPGIVETVSRQLSLQMPFFGQAVNPMAATCGSSFATPAMV